MTMERKDSLRKGSFISTEDIEFSYQNGASKATVKIPTQFPFHGSVSDLCGRVMTLNNIPCYAEEELKEHVESRVKEGNNSFYNRMCDEILDELSSQSQIDLLVQKWTDAFAENVLDEQAACKPDIKTSFGEAYHELIHSAAAQSIFALEQKYARDTRNILRMRNRDLAQLNERQKSEMDSALEEEGSKHDNAYVSQLAQRQQEHKQLIEGKWNSDLDQLQQTQKTEYHETVLRMRREQQEGVALEFTQRPRTVSGDMDDNPLWEQPALEESFTVHLGAQLKTMHNIRLMACNTMDLCRLRTSRNDSVSAAEPRRMQTAMSLYSDKLCALVLLEDPAIHDWSGLKQEFADICEETPELHFTSYHNQVAQLEGSLTDALTYRRLAEATADESCDPVTSPASLEESTLGVGDFYMTRHSNLRDAHVVFHLAADSSLRGPDVNSRHPLLQGLRQVIRICFRSDIYTLTLPLLLVHSMTEELTLPWCVRRAELVLKCVKGYMMEMSTWSQQQPRTLQFLVPPEVSEQAFQSFSNMLPQIFKTTKAKVIRS